MNLRSLFLGAGAFLVGISGNSQTYNQSSGNVCSAYTDRFYTFTDTPETPVAGNMSVSWLYCGPWGNSNSGTLDMEIWIDDTWVDLIYTSDSGNGCGWTTDSFTISANMINDAINSNGGTILVRGSISDSCPGGVGCGGYSDPCFNITLTYEYAPDADFSVNNTETCVNGMVTFENETSGPQDTYSWDFGADAVPATAEGIGPHDVYWTTEGEKDITLTVNGNNDESIELKSAFVSVGGAPSSIVFGEAFESWQQGAYDDNITSKRILRNNLDGYYVIGEVTTWTDLIWIQRINEDGDEMWFTSIASGYQETFHDAIVDAEGNLFITGQREFDLLLAKITPDGLTDWYAQHNFSAEDEGTGIDLDSEGNIYVSGSSNNLYDATAAKFDSDGAFVFDVTISGDGANRGTDILFLDDHFYLLSWGRTDGINPDMHLSKYEPLLGIHQWTVDYNGNGFAIDEAHELESFGDYIYMMGKSDQGAEDGWTVVQVSTDGVEGWSSDFFMGETNWEASDRFAMDDSGNLFLASTIDADADQAVRMLKINKDTGAEMWQHDVNGINATWLEAIDVADNDNLFILCSTVNNSGDWDLATFEMNQVPSDIWWAVYDGCGSSDDFTGGLVATPNHEVISTGFNSQAVGIRYGALVEPDANFEMTSSAACVGSPVTFEDLSTGSALTYDWDFGPGATPATAEGQGPHEVMYDSPGTKTASLIIENGLGTSNFDLDVEVFPAAEIVLSEDMAICAGDSAELTATGEGMIEWDDALGNEETIEVSPDESATFSATLTDANGCTASGSIEVTVFEYPDVDAGDDITVCEGEEVTLDGSGDGELAWDNNAGDGPTPTLVAEETTTYTITASNEGGCESEDSMLLTVEEAPDVSAGADESLCEGESVELMATGAESYIWSPGDIEGSMLEVTPEESTTYTVVGTGANDCVAEAQVTVTVYAIPEASAGEDETICSGTETTITASGGSSYDWDDLGPGVSHAVSPSETTTYTVNVTNEFGCTAIDDVTITVNESPVANAGDDVLLCIGNETTLIGSGGVSYEWLGEGVGQTLTVSPEANTVYTLEVSAENGCTDQDEVTVSVLPLPNVNAGADVSICLGESTTLNAVGGETYDWDNGLGEGQSQEVSPLFNTTYVVEATDGFGCSNMDTVVVSVNSLPAANAGADQVICPGETATLNASGGMEYEWDNGAGDGASVDVSPTETTTYTVTAIDSNGCEGTDDVTIEVHPVIELSISGLTNDPYCVENDDVVTLSGDPAGGEFSGSGVSGNEFVAANAGVGTHEINYTYEDNNGCEHETSVEVLVEVCGIIGQLSLEQIELYPNPNSGQFSIVWQADITPNIENVKVHDMSGRLVELMITTQNDRLILNLTDAASGSYTVSLLIDGRVWSKSFIVSK